MDALEGGLVIVGRFAPVSDQLLADVPLRVEGDASRQMTLAVGFADLTPQDGFDLSSRRRGGYDKCFARRMSVEPP